MLPLTILSGLAVFFFALLWYVSGRRCADKKRLLLALESDSAGLIREHERLERSNEALQREVSRMINLYELTRDMCLLLDPDQIFARFNHGLARFIPAAVCFWDKEDVRQPRHADTLVVQLMLDKQKFGCLRCERIADSQREFFEILSQQFLLAIRRAILYEQVQGLIVTDGLTQTLSRRYFLERFREELERSRSFKFSLSFLMIDIDHFKECNDTYGHLVGDAMLRTVSMVLKDTIRQMDFIGRYGGEEISIVLVETDKAHALLAAERIRAAIEAQELEVYGEIVRSTISIGVASFPDDHTSVDGLIEKADSALYQAKEAGRNRVVAANS